MKLLIEKHPEFDRLSRFFQKIESLANHHGIKIDELVKHNEPKDDVISHVFSSDQKLLSEERKAIFTHSLKIVR